jgi:hypothetical protein
MTKGKRGFRVSAIITRSQRATIERIGKKIKRLNGVDMASSAIVRATIEAAHIRRLRAKGGKMTWALARII